MKVKEINPSQCFTGLDRNGWLDYPNMFYCPKCDYGVYFNKQSLENGLAKHQDKSLKLNFVVSLFFKKYVRLFLSKESNRFVLDFHCPKCRTPYVIGFESVEFHMADDRFRPLMVYNFV